MPPHHGSMGGQASAGDAVGVVQEGWAIHAHAHVDAIALKAIAPGPINRGGIGLQRLHDRAGRQTAPLQEPADPLGGLVVERNRRHQRFARMPEQG